MAWRMARCEEHTCGMIAVYKKRRDHRRDVHLAHSKYNIFPETYQL